MKKEKVYDVTITLFGSFPFKATSKNHVKQLLKSDTWCINYVRKALKQEGSMKINKIKEGNYL